MPNAHFQCTIRIMFMSTLSSNTPKLKAFQNTLFFFFIVELSTQCFCVPAVNFPPKLLCENFQSFPFSFFALSILITHFNFHFNPIAQHFNELIRLNYPTDWVLIPFLRRLKKIFTRKFKRDPNGSKAKTCLRIFAARCWEKIIFARILCGILCECVENSALSNKREM